MGLFDSLRGKTTKASEDAAKGGHLSFTNGAAREATDERKRTEADKKRAYAGQTYKVLHDTQCVEDDARAFLRECLEAHSLHDVTHIALKFSDTAAWEKYGSGEDSGEGSTPYDRKAFLLRFCQACNEALEGTNFHVSLYDADTPEPGEVLIHFNRRVGALEEAPFLVRRSAAE